MIIKETWSWLEEYVRENYVLDYDGIMDERPLDAADAMFKYGMTNEEIIRAMAQIWNAAIDSEGGDGS